MPGGSTIRRLALPASLCLLAGGCGGGAAIGPETVTLQGKIEFTKGGSVARLADHSVAVEFQSVDQPEVKAFGEILEDGTFTMTTQLEESGKPGVVPGAHRVRLNADDSGARFVHPQFLTFEKSGIRVNAPSNGDVILKVWR